jgi:sugar/nucleoside kinase (ribokinase family)
MSEMIVIAMGVHVLDVLVRPVETIPEGQGGALVDEIRIGPAGSAGGTAVTLSKLGATVRSAGAIGTDPVGDMLASLLERHGVDTSLIVRRAEVQTSASVLPIRPNGERPAFHVIGANATYGPDDAPWDAIAAAGHLHLGGPEFVGGEAASRILTHAREQGVVTSADILAPGDPGLLEWIAPALPQLDYLLPNAEQVQGFTGARDVGDGCRTLVERGVGCVAATCGSDGVVIVDQNSAETVPAFAVEVVDTTGCGDAFSAGFLRGLALGRSRTDAAVLGCAAAALVAQGLGSDHGEFDLAAVDAFATATPRHGRAEAPSTRLD